MLLDVQVFVTDRFWPQTGAAYYFNFLRTPGVNNIEKRFSSGGATPDHTPAAATPRGNSDQVIGNQDSHKGLGTSTHEEKIGEQRPQVSRAIPYAGSLFSRDSKSSIVFSEKSFPLGSEPWSSILSASEC